MHSISTETDIANIKHVLFIKCGHAESTSRQKKLRRSSHSNSMFALRSSWTDFSSERRKCEATLCGYSPLFSTQDTHDCNLHEGETTGDVENNGTSGLIQYKPYSIRITTITPSKNIVKKKKSQWPCSAFHSTLPCFLIFPLYHHTCVSVQMMPVMYFTWPVAMHFYYIYPLATSCLPSFLP